MTKRMSKTPGEEKAEAESKQHELYAVLDAETDEVLRYVIARVERKNPARFRVDSNETVKLISDCETFAVAARLKEQLAGALEKWSPTAAASNPHDLGLFDERVPDNPRLRAAAFRCLPNDVQESLIYTILCATGLPLKRMAAWLCIKPTELSHIGEDVVEAARAELDMRIAKRMVFFALQNKSPAAMSATLYLTKVFLKWNEQGMDAGDTGSQKVDINVNVVRNDNPEVLELRDTLDQLVAQADQKAAARVLQ